MRIADISLAVSVLREGLWVALLRDGAAICAGMVTGISWVDATFDPLSTTRGSTGLLTLTGFKVLYYYTTPCLVVPVGASVRCSASSRFRLSSLRLFSSSIGTPRSSRL